MISTERADGVTTIWLDRPERRNALTPGMLTELLDETQAAISRGDAILLAGRGKVFCAGFDLAMCKASSDGAVMRLLLTGLSDVCQHLRSASRPVVIAAHGAAIAGGCALLGGADVVIADRHAVLGYPVVKLGVSPAVSVPFLRQGVTDGEARCRTLMPETFDGESGFSRGLVHELVDSPDAVYQRALRVAVDLGSKPAGAFAATKSWLGVLEGMASRGEAEQALQVSLGLTGKTEERQRLGALTFGATDKSSRGSGS